MNTFSIWEFENYDKIETLVEYLLKNKNRTKKIVDEQWIHGDLAIQFRDIEGFNLGTINNISINTKSIKYAYFSVFNEHSRHKSFWLDEDNKLKSRHELVNEISCKVLIFEHNSSIKAIFFCGKSTAQKIINYSFSESIWGNIKEKVLGIKEDLLYWIFQRVKDYPEVNLSKKINMRITGLRSYMGKSKDEVNAVRGEGHRVSAMLGTIAFLFGNEQLKAVRPEIQFQGHKILIELSLFGTYKVWENAYIGSYNSLENEQRLCNICIYIATELIPKLVECYNENVINEDWSPKVKLYFLQALGTEIMDRVHRELDAIKIECELESGEVEDEQNSEEFDIEMGYEDDTEVAYGDENLIT